jgi:hypothetical protein
MTLMTCAKDEHQPNIILVEVGGDHGVGTKFIWLRCQISGLAGRSRIFGFFVHLDFHSPEADCRDRAAQIILYVAVPPPRRFATPR